MELIIHVPLIDCRSEVRWCFPEMAENPDPEVLGWSWSCQDEPISANKRRGFYHESQSASSMIKAQAWIFLTVGLGLSLLVGVVFTVIILCILAKRNKRRERRFEEITQTPRQTQCTQLGLSNVDFLKLLQTRKTLFMNLKVCLQQYVYKKFHLLWHKRSTFPPQRNKFKVFSPVLLHIHLKFSSQCLNLSNFQILMSWEENTDGLNWWLRKITGEYFHGIY